MAKKSSKNSPYNEGGDLGVDAPDWPVDEAYTSYAQAGRRQLSQDGTSMLETANSQSGAGIMGGVAPGEPNPLGTSTTAQSKSKR